MGNANSPIMGDCLSVCYRRVYFVALYWPVDSGIDDLGMEQN